MTAPYIRSYYSGNFVIGATKGEVFRAFNIEVFDGKLMYCNGITMGNKEAITREQLIDALESALESLKAGGPGWVPEDARATK